jgi:hypothetical protein
MLVIGGGITVAGQNVPAVQRREMNTAEYVRQQWTSVKGLITRMADKMPASDYGFRPAPEMRTFAGSMAHIIQSNINSCANLLGRKHPLQGQPLESTLTTKEAVAQAWGDSVALCDDYFATVTSVDALTGRHFESSFTRDNTKFETRADHGVIVLSFLGHNNEMYGYMAPYLRLRGIVPPSSERAATTPPAPAGASDVAALLTSAMTAMGGESMLAGLKGLRLEAMGHQWALEQSERPEGPWLSMYGQRTEVRDLAANRRILTSQRRDWNFPDWSPASDVIATPTTAARRSGERWGGGSPMDIKALEQLALEPERLLLTIRAARDAKLLSDEVQQGVRQRVIAFTYDGRSHRLFLNAWTHLPTLLELVRHDDMWGDVTERRWYSFWRQHNGGLIYPSQITTEWNGLPYSDWTVHRVEVNPTIDESAFQIPDEAAKAFATNAARPFGMGSLTLDESRVTAINDWITQIPGGFNVAFVRQPDGVVVFEATTTSAYSASVLALAEKRFPGVPVKAVVTTSDAWPHLSGIREYAARGIPIYALDLNVPILSRMIAAPRTLSPDAQARAPQAGKFTAVSERTVIGSGDTRIELLPVRGEMGERMMLAWMPGARLLYSSDLIQRGRPGTNTFFMPMMLAEVAAAAEREQLGAINSVFGMHLPLTPWADVTAAIAASRK